MPVTAQNNNELISKRWAHALIEITLEDKNISKEDILDDLKEVAQAIEESDELSNALYNPSVSTEEKQIVLCKLFQNRIMPLVYNFIFAMNLKKRLNIISQVAIEFAKELEEIKNIIHVDVTSAIEISDEKKQNIKNKISEKLKKDVIIDWGINPEIIAGLIFNIDETIIDNSVRHKLNDLEKSIIKN